jgi:uncharacterized membrane protein
MSGGGRRSESRWGAAAAVVVAMALQVAQPEYLTPGPRWAVSAVEGALLVALLAANPTRITTESRDARVLSLLLIAVVGAANALALGRLVVELLAAAAASGRLIILSAVEIWLTNIVVFALTYWEVDRGGPHERSTGVDSAPDFLFPQMTFNNRRLASWSPSFIDYLYVSFTNSTAFSPTDAMPLSRRMKAAMLLQGLLSLVTLGLVVARAVNILT